MSYLQAKAMRKKKKYHNILMRTLGIPLVEDTTKVILICNGGLTNGLTSKAILDVFGNGHAIERIIMIPKQSFSIVSFAEVNDSSTIYKNFHMKEVWPEIKGPLFLAYIEKVPNNLDYNLDFYNKPDGLIILEDFISEDEEENILRFLQSSEEINSDLMSSQLKYRKVQHYGYEFKYSTNNVDLNEPIAKIPIDLDYLWDRLKNHSSEIGPFSVFEPDQLTINYYEPGQGIPPHVDTHSAFSDGIFSLSLQSDIVMEFKKSGKCCEILLRRRSLCIMTGESRYDWTHGITPRKSDLVPCPSGGITSQERDTRISLTFRKTKADACSCNFPDLCDSAMRKNTSGNEELNLNNLVLENEIAAKVEENHVHDVYEKIASHFSETRHKPWPNVEKFVKSFGVGSILIDVGCGNGKYFSAQSLRFEVGCDVSGSLLKVCRQRGFECYSCNCLSIPIKDNCVDGCISIAVVHHLSSEERRRKAIEEIARVLKSDGRALIYVWAKNQEMHNKKSNYLFTTKDSQTPLPEYASVEGIQELVLPIHTNRTNFCHSDLLVPWKLKSHAARGVNEKEGSRYLRFYHVFEDNELKNLCERLCSIKVIDYYYDQGNWCIIIQKI